MSFGPPIEWDAGLKAVREMDPADWEDGDTMPSAACLADLERLVAILRPHARTARWSFDGSIDPADITISWPSQSPAFFAIVADGKGSVSVVGRGADRNSGISTRISLDDPEAILAATRLPYVQEFVALEAATDA